ncbi:histidine kinase dimerization/phosphoacceptor domain -containing protein [Methanospirillum sp.]|uniref:histidine kinase dimerization/phosphoacceptor domain -containing protein n=1 Tax=Methanospirillum sp. TaxID=45200 RepID=UPI0035A0042A
MIHILLVDDEPDLLDMEKRILEQKYGFSTVTAESGEKALEIFYNQPVDAIISDYSMPMMDGITLLKKIREVDNTIPFILFTIREKEDIAIEAMNHGANFYVQKENLPQVVFAELANDVKKAVGLYRAEKNLKIQRDLALAIASARSLDETLHICKQAIFDVSGMEGIAIYLYEEKKLIPAIINSSFEHYTRKPVQSEIQQTLYSVIHQKNPVFRDEEDIRAATPILFESGEICSDIFITMTHHGRKIGVVHIFSSHRKTSYALSQKRFIIDIIIQVSGYISDRLAEEALRTSENRMKNMIRNLPGMVYQGHADEERTMEFVSEAVLKLTGYYPKDIIHNAVRSWGSFVSPQDQVRIHETITRAVSKNVRFRLTYRITTRDDKHRWVLEQGAGTFDNSGNLVGIEGIIMDITRQKALDDQVRMFHNRLKTLFMLMPAGCLVFRSDRTIMNTVLVDLNSSAEKIEQKNKTELIGTTFLELFKKSDPELQEAFAGILEDKKSRTLQRCGIIYPGGKQYFDIFLSSSPVGYERTDLEIFFLYNDITSRVLAEQQIITSLGEKELLLKEVHHRVKNNLQIISGILKLQSMKIQDPQAQDIIQECRNQVYSMASIHELLYNSKNIGKIRMEEYINKLVDHFKQEYGGASARIKLLVTVDPDIVLDIERCIPCGLILNELITNAVKYAFKPETEGEIGISFTQDSSSFHMQVSDNGLGLPKEFDEKKSKSLGMELTSSLTQQLKGRLEIVSGKGTTFTIVFPKMEEDRIKV